MSHNAPDVLRSSRKLHSDLVGGTMLSNKAAAREVQMAIRANLPGHKQAAGKFAGYAATGALRRAVSVTPPRKTRDGFASEVFMAPDKTKRYQAIHEYGGIIRAKPGNRAGGYLIFRIMGRWVKVKQVRIRQKKYFRSVKPSDVAIAIRQRTEEIVRAKAQ